MYIDKVLLKYFRNYREEAVNLHPEINVFFGSNGQGKTNLLEAIYFLAASRSFRTTNDQELINWDSNYFFMTGNFIKENSTVFVEMGYQYPRRIKVKLNGLEIKRTAFIHQLPVVVFSPEDILLIKEGPSGRRRFLNLEGSRLKPLYYAAFKDYCRALQQRNRLLKEKRYGKFNQSLLEPWDHVLVKLGSSIIRLRLAMLGALEQHLKYFFAALTNSSELLSLKYVSEIDYQGDQELIEKDFALKLHAKLPVDLKRGYTSVGPHLDDFNVIIDGYDARRFSSQGQQRTAVLAIRMAEVTLFQRSSGEKPVILLDDVFSELDRHRQRQLFEFLNDSGGQSFISTAVPLDHFCESLTVEYKIFSVHKGNISCEEVG